MEAYLRLERDGYVRVRDRSGFYVVHPPRQAIPQPSTGRAIAAPLPVGISALVADVLTQIGNHKLAQLGVSTLDPRCCPTPASIARSGACWHAGRCTARSTAA
jgi:hypothetical protein